ncbi:sarcosine oxidase subunit delta [Komagataeibacter sp. FNDCF1]|nr:sarcosine oxidase subunit delta [Komagataeibacter sp. FNDCF1]MCE2563237.1 sarcosine oxidase subunit delta [Komagataeibacter sp. FNDCF1]
MRLNCPCCGPRGLEEFIYRGDATVRRPDPAASAREWVDYTYMRDNPDGWHHELWYHAAGCHCWLVVRRNTRTHEISGVVRAADVARASAKDTGS